MSRLLNWTPLWHANMTISMAHIRAYTWGAQKIMVAIRPVELWVTQSLWLRVWRLLPLSIPQSLYWLVFQLYSLRDRCRSALVPAIYLSLSNYLIFPCHSLTIFQDCYGYCIPSPTPTDNGCFPAKAQLLLADGSTRRMDNVKVRLN